MHALLTYFAVKRDTPTPDAIATMRACTDPAILDSWLQRAYQRETSTEIPGPRPPNNLSARERSANGRAYSGRFCSTVDSMVNS